MQKEDLYGSEIKVDALYRYNDYGKPRDLFKMVTDGVPDYVIYDGQWRKCFLLKNLTTGEVVCIDEGEFSFFFERVVAK